MNASEIFQECIGKRLPPLVMKYEPYKGKYETFHYIHTNRDDFETAFSALLFDAIIFYAYEKNEIEYAYEVMDAIELAKQQGKGAIALHGKMIDAPIVTRAQQTIAAAEALGIKREEA